MDNSKIFTTLGIVAIILFIPMEKLINRVYNRSSCPSKVDPMVEVTRFRTASRFVRILY